MRPWLYTRTVPRPRESILSNCEIADPCVHAISYSCFGVSVIFIFYYCCRILFFSFHLPLPTGWQSSGSGEIVCIFLCRLRFLSYSTSPTHARTHSCSIRLYHNTVDTHVMLYLFSPHYIRFFVIFSNSQNWQLNVHDDVRVQRNGYAVTPVLWANISDVEMIGEFFFDLKESPILKQILDIFSLVTSNLESELSEFRQKLYKSIYLKFAGKRKRKKGTKKNISGRSLTHDCFMSKSEEQRKKKKKKKERRKRRDGYAEIKCKKSKALNQNLQGKKPEIIHFSLVGGAGQWRRFTVCDLLPKKSREHRRRE